MSKKLTLRLDEDVIERAKEYAAQRDTSVSGLVEQYFRAVTEKTEKRKDDWRQELTDTTRSFLGSLKDVREDDYKKYLEEKYSEESS